MTVKEKLFRTTSAYKSILTDKRRDRLSHAYLISCTDEKCLRDYLKIIASLITCESNEPCGNCRTCRLIERETHSDITIYPARGEKLKAADADAIVADSVVCPIETDKRVFVIEKFEQFDKSQNKLLKTLEEPPEGVFLIMGSVNPSSVLPTVKSRATSLFVPPFSEDTLFSYMREEYTDEEKLAVAVELSDGLFGEAAGYYDDATLLSAEKLVAEVVASLRSSRDVLRAADRLKDLDPKLFIGLMKMDLGKMLRYKRGGIARLSADSPLKNAVNDFEIGALIEAIENFGALENRLKFNANRTMTVDDALFGILEAKHRWRKS